MYESSTAAARAQIFFTSPYLKKSLLVSERLSLLIYQADAECEMTLQGRIPITKSTRSDRSTYVPADGPIYAQVWQAESDPIITQGENRRSYTFSLAPAVNNIYEIRHIDNPSNIRVEGYLLDTSGEATAIELGSWSDCKQT